MVQNSPKGCIVYQGPHIKFRSGFNETVYLLNITLTLKAVNNPIRKSRRIKYIATHIQFNYKKRNFNSVCNFYTASKGKKGESGELFRFWDMDLLKHTFSSQERQRAASSAAQNTIAAALSQASQSVRIINPFHFHFSTNKQIETAPLTQSEIQLHTKQN